MVVKNILQDELNKKKYILASYTIIYLVVNLEGTSKRAYSPLYRLKDLICKLSEKIFIYRNKKVFSRIYKIFK